MPWINFAVDQVPLFAVLFIFCYVYAGGLAILDRYIALYATLETTRLNRQSEVECVRLAGGRQTTVTIDRKTVDRQSLTVPDSSAAVRQIAHHKIMPGMLWRGRWQRRRHESSSGHTPTRPGSGSGEQTYSLSRAS